MPQDCLLLPNDFLALLVPFLIKNVQMSYRLYQSLCRGFQPAAIEPRPTFLLEPFWILDENLRSIDIINTLGALCFSRHGIKGEVSQQEKRRYAFHGDFTIRLLFKTTPNRFLLSLLFA